jgi:hypothetical protein
MQRYLSGLLLAIILLSLLPSTSQIAHCTTLRKVLSQKFYFHRESSGIGAYLTLNPTYPTFSDSKSFSQSLPKGVWEIGDGWITPGVPRDINLTKGYTFAFSLWAVSNGIGVLIFNVSAYRGDTEHFLFTSDPSSPILTVRSELWWYHKTKEVTLQVKEADRLVLRLFVNVSAPGVFGFGYDCTQYPSHMSDPDVEILRPIGTGFQTRLLPSSAPNWECVNEAVANGDSDYVEHDTLGVSGNYEADLYDIPTSSIPSGSTINSIRIYHTDKKIQIGSSIVTSSVVIFRTYGTNYIDVAHALTTSYVLWGTERTFNPFTSANWTLEEINLLEIGVSLQFQWIGDTRYSYGRSTQVYIVISYNPPISKTWNYVSAWPFSLIARTWRQIAFWPFTLITRAWNPICSWIFSLNARSWQNINFWIFTLRSPGWNDVSSWIFSLETLGWHNIAFWIFSLTPFSTGFLLIPLIFLVGVVLFLMAVALGKKFQNEF